MIACCGFDCSACQAYENNINDFSDQIKASKAWSKYFEVHYPPEQMRCAGCLVENTKNTLPYKDCQIRSCVMDAGLQNCGYCGSYPCKKQGPRLKNYEAIAKKLKGCIPPEEYTKFIKPYNAKKRLDEIKKKRRFPG